jgi:hypothetical protein
VGGFHPRNSFFALPTRRPTEYGWLFSIELHAKCRFHSVADARSGMPFCFNSMTAASLIGGLIFSGVGFVAFVYGKKQGLLKATCLGIALMAYPLFVSDVAILYGVGCLLTICLFIFKD